MRSLLGFGLNITACGILGFLANQADSAVVGKVAQMRRASASTPWPWP